MAGVDVQVRPFGTAISEDYGDLPAYSPPAQQQPTGDFGDFEPYSPERAAEVKKNLPPEMGPAEEAWRGVLNTATFGLAPAVEGLSAAAGPEWHQTQVAHDFAPVVGAAKMLHSYLAGHPDEQVRRDYEEGRKKGEEAQKEAGKSWAYTTGQVLGGLATPAFGALRAGGLAARAGLGMLGGAIGGGLYGAGTGVSAGEDVPGIGAEALRSGALGGATGGVLGGTLGPRLAGPAVTQGQRAARFAESLGTPIARGLASDYGPIRATTAAFRSVPIFGSRIAQGVDEAQRAAGEHVGGIATGMAGAPTERAISDVAARSGLGQVISDNHAAQNAGYNALRGEINNTQKFTMPNTDAALNGIMAARQGAGHTNPALGLDQFRNVAAGADFEGAKRALVDARNASKPGVQHPGYDAGDYRRLKRAMETDLRGIVKASAKTNPQHALQLFDAAEQNFGRLAEQNKTLQSLLDKQGETPIATLLGAAKEKGGNVALLAQLKGQMNPQEFETIGGQLLSELGHNRATGGFSLNQFTTEWNKLSDGAKRVLFSPQHLKDIEEVANLGTQLKGSLREANVSHTAAPIILMDAIRDAAMAGVGVATGAVSAPGMLGGAALASPGIALMHYLSSPARAASASKWTRAYQAALLNPTPARTAVFKIATRNLANNLGIPAESILKRVVKGEPQSDNPQPAPPGPVNQHVR